MTPSATAKLTLWAPPVMSPAAKMPGTVVAFIRSVRMIEPK